MLNNEINLFRAAQYCATFNFPIEFFMQMAQWRHIIKSPYSLSFYSAETNWNTKVDKSFRISDHWNFTTDYDFANKIHCKTDKTVPKDYWAIGQYDASRDLFIILDIKNPSKKIAREKQFRLLTLDLKYEKVIQNTDPQVRHLVDYSFLKKTYKILEESQC